MKRLVGNVILIVALFCSAMGMGLYVYPSRPTLVWTLLAVCWICYRLHRKAQARFGKR